MFENPIVGGTTLIRPAIKSPNYVANTSGWSINADGSAEFNNIQVRGSVTLSGGCFATAASGQRITICSTPANQINFYSGDPNENAAGYLQVSVSAGWSQLALQAPNMIAGGGAALLLSADNSGGTWTLIGKNTRQLSGAAAIDTLHSTWGSNYLDGVLTVAGGSAAIRMNVIGNAGTDFGGGDRFRVWNDGEVWLNAVGIGGDNPNNTGIYFNQGNLNLNGVALLLLGNNDLNQSLRRIAAPDGAELTGWDVVSLRRADAAWTIQLSSAGFYTNFGWGLGSGGDLNSGVFGGGTGGTLKTKSNGNFVRFDWGSPFTMWVDVTNVKTFVIPHPNDETKALIHACLEGPESAVFYRGTAQLVNGWVEVKLPDYFENLCAIEGRSVLLTCIADDPADEWCPVLHATYPKNGRFFVGLGSGVVVLDQRFWWQVTAVRKDVAPLLVEPSRDAIDVLGQGPYTYYRER